METIPSAPPIENEYTPNMVHLAAGTRDTSQGGHTEALQYGKIYGSLFLCFIVQGRSSVCIFISFNQKGKVKYRRHYMPIWVPPTKNKQIYTKTKGIRPTLYIIKTSTTQGNIKMHTRLMVRHF